MMDLSVSGPQSQFRDDLKNNQTYLKSMYAPNQMRASNSVYGSNASLASSLQDNSPDGVFDCKPDMFNSSPGQGRTSRISRQSAVDNINNALGSRSTSRQSLTLSRSSSVNRLPDNQAYGSNGLNKSNLRLNMPSQQQMMSQSMTQTRSSKTPTAEIQHPPSVNLNRTARKFSRSQSCLNEQDIQRRRQARIAQQQIMQISQGDPNQGFSNQAAYNKVTSTTNIPKSNMSRESSYNDLTMAGNGPQTPSSSGIGRPLSRSSRAGSTAFDGSMLRF